MSAPKIERLMNLVAYLSNIKAAKTIREIIDTIPGYPESFDSARRAFERDKEELRAMGFDIRVASDPINESGYIIQKDTTFYNVDLTAIQRSVLQYALEIYAPQEQQASSAISKLGGMNSHDIIDHITPLPMPAMVSKLHKTCSDRKPSEIIFKGSARQVQPLKIIAKGGYWYFEALDLEKNEQRTFRIDRITKIDEIDIPKEALPAPSKDMIEDQSQTRIIVKVHPLLMESFCVTWNAQYDPAKDTVSFDVSRPELFVSQLFEYSGFVAIVAPESLQELVNSNIAKAIASLKETA